MGGGDAGPLGEHGQRQPAFAAQFAEPRRDPPLGVKVLVAKIIPVAPASCPACGQRVVDLDAAIPGWAAGISTQQSPVVVVDQWTGFLTDGRRITQIWNGAPSADGAAVTVRDAGCNGSLAAGGTATSGFLASWNGVDTAPVLTCVSG
ncbi:cellulose binding domain-containing protein [Nonomuraea rhodomycinica]|uniref:cellulose binding domain-containing protein n=1 Tax=Nonomuraea rhodomycinica TaxID=1712872 RepID=UPI0028AFEE8E|nr:cellulose binding domain-containing protein [Nonomuraea rhodomycinica]